MLEETSYLVIYIKKDKNENTTYLLILILEAIEKVNFATVY